MTRNRAAGLADEALSSTERHGRNLRAVNEKLAELVASLRDQKERLSVYSRSGAPPAAADEEVAMEPIPMETTLTAELALARDALRQRQAEQARLGERLGEIEAENRRICDEFVAVQEQNTELVSLYAAVERLHGAPTRSDVFVAIQEIVVNMIGSEEFALFELTSDGGRLAPAHAFGVEAGGLEEIAIGSGIVGRVVAEGQRYVAADGIAPPPGDVPPLAACVPFKLGDEVTAALVIFRLLGHKPSLTEFDRELFSVLERHAALALQLRRPEPRPGSR